MLYEHVADIILRSHAHLFFFSQLRVCLRLSDSDFDKP